MTRPGEIPDSYVSAFYRLVEGDYRDMCPECGCPLSYDRENDQINCPKCGYAETE